MLYKHKISGVILDLSNKVITIISDPKEVTNLDKGYNFPYSGDLPISYEPYAFISYLELIEK